MKQVRLSLPFKIVSNLVIPLGIALFIFDWQFYACAVALTLGLLVSLLEMYIGRRSETRKKDVLKAQGMGLG